mmetsp:Transcript_2857/g.5657  ORF Transcript_2857/g.5657 Transcript_2857/m.5657 type:complete len:286 (-) Transcript_2857:512-1369(-)
MQRAAGVVRERDLPAHERGHEARHLRDPVRRHPRPQALRRARLPAAQARDLRDGVLRRRSVRNPLSLRKGRGAGPALPGRALLGRLHVPWRPELRREGEDVGELAHAEQMVLVGVRAGEGHGEELHGDLGFVAVAEVRVEDLRVRLRLVRAAQGLHELLPVPLGGHELLDRRPLQGASRPVEQDVGQLCRVMRHAKVLVQLDDDVADRTKQRLNGCELLTGVRGQDLQPHASFQPVVYPTDQCQVDEAVAPPFVGPRRARAAASSRNQHQSDGVQPWLDVEEAAA